MDKRLGLNEALSFCREGDTLIVWELDRLWRSLKHLIEIVDSVKQAMNIEIQIDDFSRIGFIQVFLGFLEARWFAFAGLTWW